MVLNETLATYPQYCRYIVGLLTNFEYLLNYSTFYIENANRTANDSKMAKVSFEAIHFKEISHWILHPYF